MNKKLLFLLILVLVIIAFGYYIILYSSDPFGGKADFGSNPNCGEDRYKFDVNINSKEDFVNFLKTHEINTWVRLDNFKNISQSRNYSEDWNKVSREVNSAAIDWNKVLSEVKTENAGSKTIYILNYTPFTCSGFTLKMTANGYVSVSGCCGE